MTFRLTAKTSRKIKLRLHLFLLSGLSIWASCSNQPKQNEWYSGNPKFTVDDFEERVVERIDNNASDVIQSLIYQDKNASYKQYVLSSEEIQGVASDLNMLSEDIKELFLRVVRITFIENFESSGAVFALGDSGRFVMALNAEILDEDMGAFLTRKENSYRAPHREYDIDIRVSKNMPAIVGICLHELGHVINHIFQIMNEEAVDYKSLSKTLLKTSPTQLWNDFDTIKDDFFAQHQVEFYASSPKAYSAKGITDMYSRLESSAFPTLYATTDQGEDYAELFFLYTMHKYYKADFRLRVYNEKEIIKDFSLINRELILDRFDYIDSILAP